MIDVLRVGRWYEDLFVGDERVKIIIKCFVIGFDGVDDEGEFFYFFILIFCFCIYVFMKMIECIICLSFL